MSAPVAPWRVAEFWSSANPGKTCLMLAKDEQELSSWELRGDFVRWHSPDPLAAPVKECLTADIYTQEFSELIIQLKKYPSLSDPLNDLVDYLNARTARAVDEACEHMVPLSADGKSVWIDGVGDVALATPPASAQAVAPVQVEQEPYFTYNGQCGHDLEFEFEGCDYGTQFYTRPQADLLAQIDAKARKEVAEHSARHIVQLKAKIAGLGNLLDVMTKQRDEAQAERPTLSITDELLDKLHGFQGMGLKEYKRRVRVYLAAQPAAQQYATAACERYADSLALAKAFHEAYERLAPSVGYETRTETRDFDPESKNGRLMVAVCAELTTGKQPAAQVVELTDAEIDRIILWAVRNGSLSWVGYKQDNGGKYTVPVISDQHRQLAHAILAAKSAPADDDLEECPKCKGSRVQGEVRGIRCSACNGTTVKKSEQADGGGE